MGTKLTKEEKGVLSDLQAEVYRVTSNGTRGFGNVCRGLQGLIEGKPPLSVNPFVANVEQQLNAWQALGVTIDVETRERILQQADTFEPLGDDDSPLVSGGFGYTNPKVLVTKLWNAIAVYTVRYVKEDIPLRYAPGMKPNGSLRLVHYQHNAYAGLSPEQALAQAKTDHVRLASIEVLEKLLLDSESAKSWDGQKIFFPNLSGLQAQYDTDWSCVPYVGRWRDDRQLRLGALSADYASDEWSSPVVREC
jgi:hypothetical protein